MFPLSNMETDILLIGSRALHEHLPDRKIDEKETDYDFIATMSGALKWMSTFQDALKFEKVVSPFDYKTHHADIEHDIRNWKHLTKKVGQEIYETLKKKSGLTKIRGHTQTFKFEIEIADAGSSGEFILQLMKAEPCQKTGYVVASLPILEAIKTSH